MRNKIKDIFLVSYSNTSKNLSLYGYSFPLPSGGSSKNILIDLNLLKNLFNVNLLIFNPHQNKPIISREVNYFPIKLGKLTSFFLFSGVVKNKNESLFIVRTVIASGVFIKLFNPMSKLILVFESPFKQLVYPTFKESIIYKSLRFIACIISIILADKLVTDKSEHWILNTNLSFIKNKSYFLLNSIDTSIYSPDNSLMSEDCIRLLYIGRLNHREQKNPELLLKSFELIARKIQHIKLIIIGAEVNEVEDLIKNKSILKNIEFIKEQTFEELIPFYRTSNLTLITSKFEGTPYAVLESLACGTPCISTDVLQKGVIKDGENGYICSSFSEVDFTDCIEKGLELSKSLKKVNKSLLDPSYDIKHREENWLAILE
jgi:glycosyltransferase involved in cell wall biosynthesis